MFEILVGLNVTNEATYTEYRRRMTPLLEGGGGSFGYDFKVSEVLISKTSEPINRVFTIRFPSAEARESFFSDPEYLEIKRTHFTPSVSSTTVIASYER
jgi:uncharacterized protein (DUF1330 family)